MEPRHFGTRPTVEPKGSCVPAFLPPPAFGAEDALSPRSVPSLPPSPTTFGLDDLNADVSTDTGFVMELWQDFDGVGERRRRGGKRLRAEGASDRGVDEGDDGRGNDLDEDEDEGQDEEEEEEDYKPRLRGRYRCRLCGKAKRRHACPFAPAGVRVAATQTDLMFTGRAAALTRTKALAYAVGRAVSTRVRNRVSV
jgi:hypothetical protein